MLVDPELAAAGARAPIDVPDSIARQELTQVGELDPLALLPRDVVPGEHLRVERPQEIAHVLLRRVDLQRLPAVEHDLTREEPEPVVRAQVDATDAERAPLRTAQAVHQLAAFPVRESQLHGVVAVDEREAT